MENHTTSKTREALVHDVDQLKQDAFKVAQDVRSHANAHVDATRQRVNDLLQTARENLTTHSLSFLGVGFALGLFFGLRLRR